MFRLRSRIWIVLLLASLILSFGHADAQQEAKKEPKIDAPNPYLMGTEGYYKGPRGLTSYQPIAIDQPFATRMGQDVAAKPGIEREHQTLLEERYDLGDHPAGRYDGTRKTAAGSVRVKLPPRVTWSSSRR